MDDLRVRFSKLGWRPLPDRWDGIVHRAEILAGTPALVGDRPPRVRRVAGPGDGGVPWWLGPRLSPTVRVVLVLALVATLVAGSFAFGAWYRDWTSVTLPSNSQPPSAPPPLTQVDPCPGVRSDLDLIETHLAENEERSWQPGAPLAAPADGWLTAVRMDAVGTIGVFLIDPATGVPCRLVQLGRVGLLPSELRWSPDGASLAISSQLWAGSGESHLLVWSGTGDASTLTRPWIATELPGLAWSPDGTLIALAGSRAVTFVRADGAPSRVVPCEPCRAPTRVVWSPDGSTLAIRTPAAGGQVGTTDINLIDVAGGSVRRLDAGLDRLDLVAWLDPGRLLVIDHATDRILEVSTASPGEPVARELVSLADRTAYIVAPDLTHAAFIAEAQRADERLVVVDLADNTRTTLARSGELDTGNPIGDIVWSPDSRTVAFTQVRSGDDLPVATAIWLIGLDGRGLRPLTRGPLDLLDGRYIGSGLDLGSWRPGTP